MTTLDEQINKIREDFPILKRKVRNGVSLIYLDNAATTQKPKQVVDAISNYYLNVNANVHRGIHALSEEASEMYESAHKKTSDFIGANYEELIFIKNTTEGLNIVANGLKRSLHAGDEIVLTRAEHHSNLVPFIQIAKEKGIKIKYIDFIGFKDLDMSSAEAQITDKTKLLAFPHMSNVLGTITPVKELVKLAHDHGSLVLLDGAQSVPHIPLNVKDLGVDFMAFSGHKMLAPMGTGGLYGKEEHLDELDPQLFGGDMIKSVSYDDASWNVLPYKFEAGTPNVGGMVGLGEAITYLNNIGMNKVKEIEHYLTKYAMDKLSELDFIEVYGPDATKRGGVISFNVTGGKNGVFIHPHDVSTLLDEKGIAIRAGHHCAQPLMNAMNVPATSRISFYIYNSIEEIDKTIEALKEVQTVFN
ncbi:MAG: SufS family cysteine desulfurase [Candidatus Heimdallarchaeota archaeon]|nr:SufS family cysteine desulfurase [Candidatus Heimdallarchaeota archaeon]